MLDQEIPQESHLFSEARLRGAILPIVIGGASAPDISDPFLEIKL